MPSHSFATDQPAVRHPQSRLWLLIPIMLLLLGYAFALEIQYVEGDDASSVIYHALGRNSSIQLPYASYQVLADTLLSVLPASEAVVRTVMILLSAAANVAAVVLILQLIFDLLNITNARIKAFTALTVLLGVPEFFYLGLVYTPALFAISLVVLAHLLLHRVDFALRSSRDWLLVIVSVILFCLGAAFRFDIVLYGAIITADLILSPCLQESRQLRFFQRLGIGITWGAAALLGWFVVLYLLGYSPESVLALGEWSNEWVKGFSLQTFAIVQTLTSPLIIVLFIVGLASLIRQRSYLLILLLISIGLIFRWIPAGVPKLLIIAVPMILTTSAAGLLSTLKLQKRNIWQVIQIGLLALALLPWLIGIQARFDDTAWGPGFELQDFDRSPNEGVSFRVGLLQAGAGVPTSEGPRALFGHFFVIFGGQWRTFVQTQNEEVAAAITTARERSVPLYILDGSGGYYVAELLEQGFTTDAPRDESVRVFTYADGSTVTLVKPESDIVGVLDVPNADIPVDNAVIVGEPATLRSWYLAMPEALQKMARLRQSSA